MKSRCIVPTSVVQLLWCMNNPCLNDRPRIYRFPYPQLLLRIPDETTNRGLVIMQLCGESQVLSSRQVPSATCLSKSVFDCEHHNFFISIRIKCNEITEGLLYLQVRHEVSFLIPSVSHARILTLYFCGI